jgi:superfamily I DNA/RNA helicase
VKRVIVAQSLAADYRYVNSESQLRLLELEERWFGNRAVPTGEVPVFDVKLDGELYGSSIVEAFYTQASFIESMGLHVSDAVKAMPPFQREGLEYHFCAALSSYWLQFGRLLRSHGMITFNYAFLVLASNQEADAGRVPAHALRPLTHLVIDEFQDISHQIVRWLVSVHSQVADGAVGRLGPSLMAIGDDWQSIYGWRGSAPDFFVKFDRHFPSSSATSPARKIKMVENFRSVEPIIRDAEAILESVSNKTEKSSVPTRVLEDGDHGVRLIVCEDLLDKTLAKIAAFIVAQWKYAKQLPNAHKNKVIVMSRRNDVVDRLASLLRGKDGIVFYTYHRSKGLQGEVAVMVEDCDYDQAHKLRNRVYVASGLFEDGYSYDDAMFDESRRLAYVGATRGKRRTFWFVEKTEGAAQRFLDTASLLDTSSSMGAFERRSGT